MQELALDPLINESAKNFLQPYCDGLQLHFTSAVSIGPGESPKFSTETEAYGEVIFLEKLSLCLALSWAASKFTKENGATQIVPGSIGGIKKTPQPDEIAYAEMEAGSVLIYTGTVLHGGGENTTSDEIRTGVFSSLRSELDKTRRKSILIVSSRNCQRT